jgi:hypothetical protein
VSARDVLQRLRTEAVVTATEGEQLRLRSRTGLVSELLDAAAKHKSEIIALVDAGWWPEGQARPSLRSVMKRHGTAGFREAFLLVTGCDINVRAVPSWEELYVFDLHLATSGLP